MSKLSDNLFEWVLCLNWFFKFWRSEENNKLTGVQGVYENAFGGSKLLHLRHSEFNQFINLNIHAILFKNLKKWQS